MSHRWEEQEVEAGTGIRCAACGESVLVPKEASKVERTVVVTAYLSRKAPGTASLRALPSGRWTRSLLQPMMTNCEGAPK